jgi:hypothetical protein
MHISYSHVITHLYYIMKLLVIFEIKIYQKLPSFLTQILHQNNLVNENRAKLHQKCNSTWQKEVKLMLSMSRHGKGGVVVSSPSLV